MSFLGMSYLRMMLFNQSFKEQRLILPMEPMITKSSQESWSSTILIDGKKRQFPCRPETLANFGELK